jgi:flagellar hook protein FlgE
VILQAKVALVHVYNKKGLAAGGGNQYLIFFGVG